MKTDVTKINYIEWASNDLEQTKEFYNKAFGWTFQDYGAEYVAITNGGIDGGFYLTKSKIVNGALIVLYHIDLDQIKSIIISSGGLISKDVFSFPGGKRFHFLDPSGNELAVWSDK